MKILYDHLAFEQQQIGGVSRYFAEIISNLDKDISIDIGLKYSNNIYLNEKNLIDPMPIPDYRHEFIKGYEFKGKGRLFKMVKKLNPSKYPDISQVNLQYSVNLLKKQDFDVFHPTQFNTYFLEFINKKPFVITIHDMIHELFPEYYTPDNKTAIYKKELIKRANHIIAVSSNTKNDIINFYGVNEDKITVIHHGVNLPNKANYNNSLPTKKYLLYVGSREGYKNFIFFVRAVSDLLIAKDLQLICTGTPFNRMELVLFKMLHLENRLLFYYADDTILASLYQNALCFISPSLYEGFGMPILEAFSNNCPVALSDSSCYPEIGGEAALYFNPKNENEIKQTVLSIINNELLRKQLISSGRERLNLFSWKKSAEKTIFVYRSVLS